MATRQPYRAPVANVIDLAGFDANIERILASESASSKPATPSRTTARAAGDVGLALGQGAVGAFKSISDIFGADNAVSSTLGDVNEGLQNLKSDQSKATLANSQRRIQEAEATGDWKNEVAATMQMLWDQPAEMLAQGAGSFATLGVGKLAQAAKLTQAAKAAGVSKAAFLATDAGKEAAKAAAEFAFKANVAVGAGQGVGAVKGSQYEQTLNAAKAQGMGDAEARALASESQAYGGPGTMQQLLGGVLGAGASATGPIERMVAGKAVSKGPMTLMGGLGKGFATEGATEGAQGAQERYAGNDAAIDAGVLDESARWRGVAGQGVQEGVVGGLLGAGPGGLEAMGNKAQAAADAKAQAAAAAQAEADAAAAAIRANKQPGSGPLSNAVNAGTEADAQRVEVAGASAAAAIASAPDLADTAPSTPSPEGSAEFINPDFQARQQTLAEQMASPENREKVRARFGDDGLNQVLYYAQAAGRADIPAKTSDNMLQVAERMMGEVLLQPLGGDAQLGGMVRDPLMLDSPEQTGAQPLGLGLDQTPSGRFTVGPDGTATAETRVQQNEAQRRAQEIDSLGNWPLRTKMADGDILNPSGQPFKTLVSANLAAKKTPGDVVAVDGGFVVRPAASASITPETGNPAATDGQTITSQSSGAVPTPAQPATPAPLTRARTIEPGPAVVLQNRDRSSAASVAQMNEIAAKPDYLRAGPARVMDSGAPVVFGETPSTAVLGREETVADGRGNRTQVQYMVVEAEDLLTSHSADGSRIPEYEQGAAGKLRAVAGNGRAAGIANAYTRGTAEQYRADLAADAPSLGIDQQSIQAMSAPVLVRVMSGNDVTPDIGDRSNISGTARLSASEQATTDARRINLSALEFDEQGDPAPESVRQFISGMPTSERGELLNKDGTPTRQAIDRIMAATFKQAYGSDDLVQLYAQATDIEARTVMTALADAAGAMSNLTDAGDLDIRGAVSEAAGMAVNARRKGTTLADALKNADLDTSGEAFVIARFFSDNIRSAKKIADGLRNWANYAAEQAQIARDNQTQDGLFGAAPVASRYDIFQRIENGQVPKTDARQPARQELATDSAQRQENITTTGQVGPATGQQQSKAQAEGLTAPTQADIEAQQARAEQAEKSKAAQAKADAARAAKERERKDIAAASVAAADTFELGGDAMSNLTGQNDLQFSRAAAKEVRNLVTLHNLSEENLMYAGKMGGIPAPSIGITKVETPFGGFGGITLIAQKDLIDPESGVPVYDRDAWTARFPKLNFKKVKAKVADAFYERMQSVRDFGSDGGQFMSMLFEELRNSNVQAPDKITSLFTRYTAPKMLYAQEVLGKTIKPPMRDIKSETPFGHAKSWRDFVAKNYKAGMTEQQEKEFNRLAAVAARAAMAEINTENKARVDERTARMLDSSMNGYLDRYISENYGMNAGILDRAVRDVKSFGKKEVDPMKLDEAVRKVVPTDDAGYNKWIANLVEPLFEAPTITLRGAEVPVTLDNIVDAMTIGKTAGAEKSMTFGAGKAASMLGKQFKSIDEIKAARDRVVSTASESEGKKSTEALISEYQNHVSEFYTGKDWKGNIDTWAALDSSLEALTKAGRTPTDASMNIALQRAGFKRVDAKGISLAKQALEALRDATTDYFEAKPQRAVRLNEFKGAVVPKGTSAEAISLLEENGITVEVHGNAEGAREKAIQKLAKKLDGKTGNVIFSRDTESPRTPASTIRAAITKAYGNLLDKLEAKGLVTIAQTEREAIEAAAQARADKTGGDAKSIAVRMMSMAGLDVKYSANGNIEGFFDKQTGKSFLVADNLTAASAPGTLMHEVGIHMAADGKLEPLFKRAGSLLKTGTQNEFIQRVKARMARAGETSDEEAAAYIVTEYENNRAKAPITLGKWIADLTAAVRAWLFSKGIILKAGQLTVADIAAVARANARSMARGGLNGGPGGGQAFSRSDMPATIEVDGKTRSTMNSNGQPIHPTLDGVRNFWKWLGDSKVVDEQGRPLVVYHGTAYSFDEFDPGMSGNTYGADEEGIFFTTDTEEADVVSIDARNDENEDQSGSNVMPVFLSFKNPLTVSFDEFSWQPWEIPSATNTYDSHKESILSRFRAGDDDWNDYDGIVIVGKDNHKTFVAFEPTQVKSATGNTGAFSAADPDIRFSRAADMAGNAIDKAKQTADKAMGKDFHRAASMPDLNDDQRSLLGKVGASQSPASDAIKAATDRASLKIRQGMVDRFAALKELDEKALGQNFIADSITNSAWVLAKMSSAGSGALNAMMKSGRIEMDATQKVIGLKGAPNGGLTASLQKLGGPAEVERFFAWMAANRAEKLMGEGRENLFTPAEIAAGKTLNTGSTEGGKVRPALYSQVHAEFQQYRDDVLAIAEQTGIINSDNRAMWRDEFYVPFYRVMEDDADRGRSGGNGLSRQEAYKKLKGGKQNLNDLMENTLMNFHHLLSASLKNQAAVLAIKNAEHVGIARKVPEARRDTKTSTFVLVDGKKVFYEVDDPLVFESITTLADPGLNNTAVRVMGAFKRLFTNMTTATPQFIIANTFRDLLQASATSPTSKNIAKNLKEGIQSYRDEKTRAEMLASGGAFSFGHIYGMSADEVKESLQKTVAGAGLISSPSMIPSMMRKMWDAWSNITDLSENASRAATYTQNVDQMGKLRAAFEARDVMDFSQHGAWPAVRLLVRIVPFLNARLQGLDKLYRSGLKPSILTAMGKGTDTDKQAAARFAMVTGALTLATMALYLVNADDDEYKKLEEWQKDTYWFIRIGENAFFLPKPFEVGAIATVAERTLQQAMDDKATGKLFRERMWEMLMQTFAFNPTPQMFQPLIDVYSNKDAFTGRDIETAGMERMSTGLRSRDSTTAPATALSAVSRVFGDESTVAVSPVQADHLIKGYLGGVGAMAAGWIDTMYRAATGQSSPDKAWSEYQPIRRFYRDLDVPVANTRYTTLFYDGLKEANRVYADVMELQKLGRPEDAATLAAEKRNVLQMRIALNAQQRRLTEINNRMKEVRRSDRDGEWKRREIDLLTTQKALITERLGKRIEDARATQ